VVGRGGAGLDQGERQADKALAEGDVALKGGNDVVARLAYPLRAACLLEKGDVQPTLADCDRALKLDPKSVQTRVIRSVAYLLAGDANRGRADFDSALRLDKEKAYLFRADIFAALKRQNEAIADWTELIKLVPDEAVYYQA